MTLAQLKTQLAYEGKIQNDTDAISKLDNLIFECAVVLGQSHPEILLLTSVTTTPAAGVGTKTLTNAISIDRIDYTITTLEPYNIPERNNVVGPPPGVGKPKCYVAYQDGTLVTQIKIQLIPQASIAPSDSFTIWYKTIPELNDDADIVPTNWIPFLMSAVLARLARYDAEVNALQTAEAYKAGAQQALQVEVSNDSETLANTN